MSRGPDLCDGAACHEAQETSTHERPGPLSSQAAAPGLGLGLWVVPRASFAIELFTGKGALLVSGYPLSLGGLSLQRHWCWPTQYHSPSSQVFALRIHQGLGPFFSPPNKAQSIHSSRPFFSPTGKLTASLAGAGAH